MRAYGSRFALAALLSALVAPTGLAAQSGASPPADTAAKQPDPPPPPVNHLETALAGFKLTGFAAGSYSYSGQDRKSTRLNSSHVAISYAVFCLKKKIVGIIIKRPLIEQKCSNERFNSVY